MFHILVQFFIFVLFRFTYHSVGVEYIFLKVVYFTEESHRMYYSMSNVLFIVTFYS